MKTPLFIACIATFLLLGCGSGQMAKKASTNNQNSNTLITKDNHSITNKYWKLVTLEGKKVTMAKNQEREAQFMLKTEQNRVTGFAGCNTFSGTYTISNGFRIRFSQMAATMKACPDVDVSEGEFLKVFELTDNYTVSGDTLSLNVGRREPLAVFNAVYFH